jgi:hypothetical protein
MMNGSLFWWIPRSVMPEQLITPHVARTDSN